MLKTRLFIDRNKHVNMVFHNNRESRMLSSNPINQSHSLFQTKTPYAMRSVVPRCKTKRSIKFSNEAKKRGLKDAWNGV